MPSDNTFHLTRVAAASSSYDGDLSLPLGLALGSPIFPSGCEGTLGVALELLQGGTLGVPLGGTQRVGELLRSHQGSQVPFPTSGRNMGLPWRGNSRRATWVGPQAERPRFPGPLLRRTRGPGPSSKATLWLKAQHEGALPPPCIVRKDPRDPHTARRGA